MEIFENSPLNPNVINYKEWQTLNGDYMNIHIARIEYLRNCVGVLENYMERYPGHVNYPVWENYFDSFEDELEDRYATFR